MWLFFIENSFFVEKCNFEAPWLWFHGPWFFLADYCLRINNKQNQQHEPHLATDEIAVIFQAFCLDDYEFKNIALDSTK